MQEVVKEVQAFAEMRDDLTTDSDTESDMTYDFAEDGSVYSGFSPERCFHTSHNWDPHSKPSSWERKIFCCYQAITGFKGSCCTCRLPGNQQHSSTVYALEGSMSGGSPQKKVLQAHILLASGCCCHLPSVAQADDRLNPALVCSGTC